jgi:hypothetical protein
MLTAYSRPFQHASNLMVGNLAPGVKPGRGILGEPPAAERTGKNLRDFENSQHYPLMAKAGEEVVTPVEHDAPAAALLPRIGLTSPR